jgi:hypothetical protein
VGHGFRGSSGEWLPVLVWQPILATSPELSHGAQRHSSQGCRSWACPLLSGHSRPPELLLAPGRPGL